MEVDRGDVINTANLFADIPARLPQELIQTLVTATNLRIERIVSHGHASPLGFWYDQAENEWVVLLKGAARLQFEGEKLVQMNAGDCLNIPARKRHRVEWTTPDEPTVWLAVHYGGES
jgi:cupin 2 domain-containing protein